MSLKASIDAADHAWEHGQFAKAKAFLDKICQPTGRIKAMVAMDAMALARGPDQVYEAVLQECGWRYALIGVDMGNTSTLHQDAAQCGQMAIDLATEAQAIGTDHPSIPLAMAMGYFILMRLAFNQHKAADAVRYAQQCLRVSSSDDMVLKAQDFARKVISNRGRP